MHNRTPKRCPTDIFFSKLQRKKKDKIHRSPDKKRRGQGDAETAEKNKIEVKRRTLDA
jgi:hypothetical protein